VHQVGITYQIITMHGPINIKLIYTMCHQVQKIRNFIVTAVRNSTLRRN